MAKVLGIGNALVDIIMQLPDEELLSRFSLPKGTMQLSERDFTEEILKATENLDRHQAGGGSAANTINGIANLGIDAGYIGKTGDDELGRFFAKDMKAQNIVPELLTGNNDTGHAITLITPDSERTFATYLGAAVELSADDLTDDLFEGYDYLHIEGYLVLNQALLNKAHEIAKAKNIKVSIDLASYNVVEENIDFLRDFVKKGVDIIFANEEEAKAFTGKEPEEALEELSTLCDIAVVKIGSKGSLIKHADAKVTVEPELVKAIDTTGAGDYYASGFLYGLANNLSLEKCGKIGSVLGGKIIEVIGAKLTSDQWKEVNRKVQSIV